MNHIENKDFIVDNLHKTELRKDKDGKLSLFCTEQMKAGFILGFLDGQILDKSPELENGYILEKNILCDGKLLVRPFKTKYSFIAHDDKPNVALELNPPRVSCIRDMEPGDQVLIDRLHEPSLDSSMAEAEP